MKKLIQDIGSRDFMFKRVFLIVIESLGLGALNDAKEYGDEDANTIFHLLKNRNYNLNIFEHLGLTRLVGLDASKTYGYHMKSNIKSRGRSDISGYYEMMGITNNMDENNQNGVPFELLSIIKRETGLDVIGNIRASEDTIMNEFGEMHIKTKSLIVFNNYDDDLVVNADFSIVQIGFGTKVSRASEGIILQKEPTTYQ